MVLLQTLVKSLHKNSFNAMHFKKSRYSVFMDLCVFSSSISLSVIQKLFKPCKFYFSILRRKWNVPVAIP